MDSQVSQATLDLLEALDLQGSLEIRDLLEILELLALQDRMVTREQPVLQVPRDQLDQQVTLVQLVNLGLQDQLVKQVLMA
jgi:hypothetical protein